MKKPGGNQDDEKVVRPARFAAKLPSPPKPIKRPCDHGLDIAVKNLEVQLGTIEAYNRLAAAAVQMKQQIDRGKAKPANPLYLASIRGGFMPEQREIPEV